MRRRSRDGFRRPCGRGRLRRNNSNAARRGRRGLRPLLNSATMRNDIFTATYSLGCRVERDAPRRVRPPPHRTVRAVFPHTALRVEVCIHRSRSPNLFRIVSLWSRRHRSTWTSSLRLAASSADCPSLDVPFPFVIHPLMFYQYSVNYSK